MITKEAIEAAARAMCEAWHYSKIGTPDGDAEWGRKQDQYRTQARAAITAALAAMPGPAVKVLRWKGPDSAGEYHSLDGLWGYIIRHGNGNGVWLTEVGGYFPTAESAKAAAQADYEARIMAAIEPATGWDDVRTGYEQCASCSGSGLQLNCAGEPDECSECKGNTVVPAPDLASENERLRAALEKLVKSANEVNRLGASTGPHWLTMTVAIVSAKAALERT